MNENLFLFFDHALLSYCSQQLMNQSSKGRFYHRCAVTVIIYREENGAVQINTLISQRKFEIEINRNDYYTYKICCHFLFTTSRYSFPQFDFLLLSSKKTNLQVLWEIVIQM